MTSAEAAAWLYASDLMAQLGDDACDEVANQHRTLLQAGDRDGARRMFRMFEMLEALMWEPGDCRLN